MISNIAARLDRLPICKFHYKFFGLVSIGMFFDGLDMYVVASVMAAIVKTGWTTVSGAAQLMSINLFGYLIGAAVAGYLGDRFGRRTMFVWSMLIYSVGTILCALSINLYMLLALRFVTAFGTGGEVVTGYAVMGEFIPPSKRGEWGNLIWGVTGSAMPIVTFLGVFVMPINPDAWRYMLALPGIPAFIAWFIRRSMPESPRWYESVGRKDEAERTMATIEAEVERYTGKKLPDVAPVVIPKIIAEKKKIRDLFKKYLLPRTIVILVIYVVTGLGVYGMTMWIPTHFVNTGFTIAKSLKWTAAMTMGCPAGALVGWFIAEKIYRKWGIVTVSIIGAILAYLFATSKSDFEIVWYGFATVTSLYCVMGLTYAVYIPELLPTELRTTGSGFGMAFARIIAAFSPFGVVFLMSKFGFEGVIIALGALFVLMGITVATLGVETRGKTLEEIQAIAVRKLIKVE